LIVLIVFVVFSCNNSNNNNQSVTSDIKDDLYDSAQGKSFVYTKYELPLSVEVYKLLKSKNIPFNKQLLLGLENQDKNFTEEKRALVLGIYSSDLVYATIFEQNQEAIDYFGVSIELAHKLDIEDGYNSNLLDKAYKNIDNTDSLNYVAGEAYWRTCTNLEKNNRTNILPLIVLGSWTESVHIMAKASIGSSMEAGLFKELYNQKEHLKSLILYFNDVISNPDKTGLTGDMKKWLKKLELIFEKYNEINASEMNSLGVDQLKNIIFQIEDLRSMMIE